MSLAEHLRISTPLIWVRTDEPERIIDFVAQFSQRKVYRMDPFEGLCVYQNGEWKVCVIEDITPDGPQESNTTNLGDGLRHAYDNQGVFLLTNAHIVAEGLLDFFSGIYGQYRQAFQKDDKDKLAMQLIMLSCKSEVPPEIARHVANIGFDLPTVEELAGIVTHIATNTSEDVLGDRANTVRLPRSGLGLTEAEFMQATVLSLRQSQTISADFIDKFKRDKIKQGGILEIRKPRISFDDVGGLDLAKDLMQSAVWSWNHPEETLDLGIDPLRRILLIGIQGCGKSMLCEAIAQTFGFDLAIFGVSKMMSKWIGESEANMRFAFAQVNAMQPVVCWMDELARDLSGSGVANDGGTTDRVHAEFLTGLQELGEQVFLVGAANRIDGLPPEMLRADRFDKIMFVGFPTAEERVEIFRIHLGKLAGEYDLEKLAEATPAFTGAEIKSLVKETKFRISSVTRKPPTTDDIINLIPSQRNRLILRHRGLVEAMYNNAMNEYEWASSGQLAEAAMIFNGKPTVQSAGKASSYTPF